MARKFSEFLGKVEHGRTIQVLKHRRAVARLVPDCDFMDGKAAADLFRGHSGDAAAAAAIAKKLSKLNEEEANAWIGKWFTRGNCFAPRSKSGHPKHRGF